mgnify:CR=1 FL=1
MIPGSKKFRRVLGKWFTPEGENKMVKAFQGLGSQISGRTGSGVGETFEEFGQEIGQIFQDDNKPFFDELEKRFGTLDKTSKFLISSFVMGFAMGGGDTSMSKISQQQFTEGFAELKETNPEEAKKVEESIKAIGDDVNTVLEQSVSPEKQAKQESGEAGYFEDDKEITKDEVLEKVEAAKNPEDLAAVDVLNDEEVSNAVIDKMVELDPKQEDMPLRLSPQAMEEVQAKVTETEGKIADRQATIDQIEAAIEGKKEEA